MSVINDYVAGAIGGASGLIVGHPFDTIKVQLHTTQTTSPYKSTFVAIKNVGRQGMAQGFFRGMEFPLISYGIINSVFFGVYGQAMRVLQGSRPTPSHTDIVIAGIVGGCVQLSIACPVDSVKVILQSQISRSDVNLKNGTGGRQFFTGPMECIRHMVKHGGVKTLYTGLTIMAIRDVPALVIYMSVYEKLYAVLSKRTWTDDSGIISSLLAGGVAGVASWALVMPFDVLKSNLQSDYKNEKYKGIIDCSRQLYRAGGFPVFFTGLVISSCRAFPVNAVTFLFYSQILRFLNNSGTSIPESQCALD